MIETDSMEALTYFVSNRIVLHSIWYSHSDLRVHVRSQGTFYAINSTVGLQKASRTTSLLLFLEHFITAHS